MQPPVELNLPSGLRIVMYPKPPRYRWWPFTKVYDGETELELYQRFAQAIRSVDFNAVANLYDPPCPGVWTPEKHAEHKREMWELSAGLRELFGNSIEMPEVPRYRKKKKTKDLNEPVVENVVE